MHLTIDRRRPWNWRPMVTRPSKYHGRRAWYWLCFTLYWCTHSHTSSIYQDDYVSMDRCDTCGEEVWFGRF